MHPLITTINTNIYDGPSEPKDCEWETPQLLFDVLNKEFRFTLDPCATEENAKCDKFFTKDQDGLTCDWSGERVFCNPPYGKQIKFWLKKGLNSRADLVVYLLPTYMESQWFHELIVPNFDEIRFVRGRLRFGENKVRNKYAMSPFASMIVVWRSARNTNNKPFVSSQPDPLTQHRNLMPVNLELFT